MHQWETHVNANSTKASNESNLYTLDLKRDEFVKRNDVGDKKVKKDVEA